MQARLHSLQFRVANLLLVLSAALAAGIAGAQTYPSRPVRLIIPYAAGGGTDILARYYQPGLAQRLGQPIVIENRGGGGGLIGIRAALQAQPDGYTMLFSTSIVALNPLMYKAPGYKFDDFVIVGPAGYYNYLLSVHRSVPAKDLKELIAYAKAHPNKLNYASLGAGSPTTILTKRFLHAAGIEVVEIPYGGAGPSVKDLAAGNVQMSFFGATDPYFKVPNAMAMAVADEHRLAVAPDLPTFAELGYPTIVGGTWFGVFAHNASPPAAVTRFRGALQATSLDIKDKLAETGTLLIPGKPEDFPAYVRKDLALWEADIKRLNIQLDE